MGNIEIGTLSSISAQQTKEIGILIGQLSSTSSAPTMNELQEIVASPTTTLFIARDDAGRVVGMLTLVVFRIPTGLRAVIEDVVVDTSSRGVGIGEALTLEAVAAARRQGVRSVDLTSRSSREAANRLYQRLGFERRETNVYRLSI